MVHYDGSVRVRVTDPRKTLEEAATMATDMGGYWLRYYNSPKKKAGAKFAPKAKVASAQVTEAYPPRKPDHGCAVSGDDIAV